MGFEDACGGWQSGRLSQKEVAILLGVCERILRRYLAWYEVSGLEGLIDRRLDRCRGVTGECPIQRLPSVPLNASQGRHHVPQAYRR